MRTGLIWWNDEVPERCIVFLYDNVKSAGQHDRRFQLSLSNSNAAEIKLQTIPDDRNEIGIERFWQFRRRSLGGGTTYSSKRLWLQVIRRLR